MVARLKLINTPRDKKNKPAGESLSPKKKSKGESSTVELLKSLKPMRKVNRDQSAS